MNKDKVIRNILPDTVCVTPKGYLADLLTLEDFKKIHKSIFNRIFEISNANIENISGYGEFDEECKTKYSTCREFLIDTFNDEVDGYWYHWKDMFETTVLEKDIYNKFHQMMEEKIHYCEGKRFLINNATWFETMITDGKDIGFPDWSRSGIGDFLNDFVIMDLNKPYLHIPELLVKYCKDENIVIPDFKDRYLCMAYYKGLGCLLWHASIDDTESCRTIVAYMEEIEERIKTL